jgi:hypothetical protein
MSKTTSRKAAILQRKCDDTTFQHEIMAQFALFASKFDSTSPFNAYASILNIDVSIEEGKVSSKMNDLVHLFQKWEFDDNQPGPTISFSKNIDDSILLQNRINSVFMHHLHNGRSDLQKPVGYENNFPSILFEMSEYDFDPMSPRFVCREFSMLAFCVIVGREDIRINIELGHGLAEILNDQGFAIIDSDVQIERNFSNECCIKLKNYDPTDPVDIAKKFIYSTLVFIQSVNYVKNRNFVLLHDDGDEPEPDYQFFRPNKNTLNMPSIAVDFKDILLTEVVSPSKRKGTGSKRKQFTSSVTESLASRPRTLHQERPAFRPRAVHHNTGNEIDVDKEYSPRDEGSSSDLPQEAQKDKLILHRRPTGRAPKNKSWCYNTGNWIDIDIHERDSSKDKVGSCKGEGEEDTLVLHKRPTGRAPKNKTWCYNTGNWINDERD